MDRLKIVLIAALFILVYSCSTPVKNLGYMHDVTPDLTYENGIAPGEYRVQPNDNLYIRIIGEDELMTAFLNITGTGANNTMMYGSGTNTIEFITYVVNESGTITMPRFGAVHVAGLTIREIEEKLTPEVNKLVTNTSVIVRVVNRMVTVLGEVKAPGAYPMLKYRQSIFETLGMAGDLTDYGNRKNVKLVRESDAGKFIAQLDLTDPTLLNSPYYYILPSDVIYVEPRSKLYGTKTLPFTGPLPAIISLVSSFIALFFVLK
jgi:polysaccharide export outer membrane protein